MFSRDARVGVRIRRCGYGVRCLSWVVRVVALRSRGSVLVSLLCDTVEMGVSFLGPAQRCRARGHVHRDMVPIIRCMRDGSSTEISH